MKKEQIQGVIEEGEGKIKEITGKIIGNKELEEKGNIQKNIGKVKAACGDLKDSLEDNN